MKDTKTTNTLLLIIVIPLVFYLLQTLSFIFIPLILSMFLALLLLPLMRWFRQKRIPKAISIFIVVLLVAGVLKVFGIIIRISSNEILSADSFFFENVEIKLVSLIVAIENFLGIERLQGENVLTYYLQSGSSIQKLAPTITYVQETVSIILMTAFFVVLLLSESINFERLMNTTLFKGKYTSVKTFMKIEKDIIRFVKVKFIISLFTGIGFTLACLFFDVSFPIFWGLLAFLINFVQMVGSVVSVLMLSLFAFVELDPTGTLFFFIIVITAVQVLMGGILEPVFMGKTFSVNIMTVLIMLMLWGYIWGVAGLIMSIPITVVIKIILEQFPNTRIVANLMSGRDVDPSLPWQKQKH